MRNPRYTLLVWLAKAKASRVLKREFTGHSKNPLPTTKEMTLHIDITRWSIMKSDWLYSLQSNMENLYTVSKTRPGSDCGSDHEFLIAKFRLKLKKAGKITRPFRYDLNQVPYNYTEMKWSEVNSLSCVWLFATLWTHQAPPSMGFTRQEYWSGLTFPSPGDLPYPEIEPRSPTLQADALTSEPPGTPIQRKWQIDSRDKIW